MGNLGCKPTFIGVIASTSYSAPWIEDHKLGMFNELAEDFFPPQGPIEHSKRKRGNYSRSGAFDSEVPTGSGDATRKYTKAFATEVLKNCWHCTRHFCYADPRHFQAHQRIDRRCQQAGFDLRRYSKGSQDTDRRARASPSLLYLFSAISDHAVHQASRIHTAYTGGVPPYNFEMAKP